MSDSLIILGAGDVGRFITFNIHLFDQKYEQIFILDDNPSLIGTTINECKVADKVSNLHKYLLGDTEIAIGIANPKIKERIVREISDISAKFPSFIAKNAWISKGAKVGRGTIIYPGVSVNHGSTIGDFTLLNMNCAIGHDTAVGDYSFLAPGVCTGGFTSIGRGVNMGINSSTLPRVIIGDNSIVGGNALVTNVVPADQTVVGTPAREMKK